MNEKNLIPTRIKDLTYEQDISINELAKRSRITQSTLNNIINENKSPTLKTIEKICNGLGISLHEFFDFPPYNLVKKKEATEVTSK